MGVEDRWQSQDYGRVRIITDVREITRENVIKVLGETYNAHLANRRRIKYLLEFDRGNQPKDYTKSIRPDIDSTVIDNLAAEITEFKTSYKWGNPITYKQRATFDIDQNRADDDNAGIAVINEMLNEEHAFKEDAKLAYYVETCGVGYQMVDIKRNVKYLSVFDLKTLSPLNTFVVYDNTISHKPLMGVTYVTRENGDTFYTCVTDDAVYQILNIARVVNGVKTGERDYVFGNRSGEMNPLGMVNIVEFERSYDRMGCWERQESELLNLNHLISDFTNNVEQDTQSLWWGDNLDLPEEKADDGTPTGRYKIPRSGGWILTSSGEQKKASVQPLVIQIQYGAILNNIKYRRDIIKQKCCVPVQASMGGGSTGTAMSMASGWDTAEIQAAKEQAFMEAGKMAILELILKAINESPDTPNGSPVKALNYSDIQPNILRDRNYDMATKANTLATLMNCGIAPEHAIECVKLFSDVNRVINDSKDYIDLYYDAKRAAITRAQSGGDGSSVDYNGEVKAERTGLQDTSMQATNSPITGSRDTTTGGRNGAGITKKNPNGVR